jgi:two-component system, NarL family, sensor histidine kinase DesK
MAAREADGTAAAVRLDAMRRFTRWTLVGSAAVAVLLPALTLLSGDYATAERIGAAVALAAIGAEIWRLALAGMDGLGHGAPATARTAAAAVAAFGLWVAFGPRDEGYAMLWALPFAFLSAAYATGIDPGARRAVLGAAAALVVGGGALHGGVVATLGAVAVFTADSIVLQVWIWDITLRLEAARVAAAEVAVLRERLRFAGELHDVQGHHLQAIALKAELAHRLVGVDDDAARRHAADVQELARTALADTRAVVQGYRRSDLATELDNAVAILRAAGIEATVTGSPADVPLDLQPLFGSLIREAATNLLRHSGAARCTIEVARSNGDVVVRVADDGHAHAAAGDGGSGIAGLHERFAAVGGRIEAAPRPERGFALSGRAPAA